MDRFSRSWLELTRRWQLMSIHQKLQCWVHDQHIQLIPGGAQKLLPTTVAAIHDEAGGSIYVEDGVVTKLNGLTGRLSRQHTARQGACRDQPS